MGLIDASGIEEVLDQRRSPDTHFSSCIANFFKAWVAEES